MASAPPRVEVLAPAKINLFLHVTGRREDGYHELFTLMCRVGLYDTLSLDFGSAEIAVTCNDPSVPEDETNLAFRAADRFGLFMALGIISSITFYIVFNIGMTIGLFPITGLPLPLLSYGGSALITNFFALGLLLNIEMRRMVH